MYLGHSFHSLGETRGSPRTRSDMQMTGISFLWIAKPAISRRVEGKTCRGTILAILLCYTQIKPGTDVG